MVIQCQNGTGHLQIIKHQISITAGQRAQKPHVLALDKLFLIAGRVPQPVLHLFDSEHLAFSEILIKK